MWPYPVCGRVAGERGGDGYGDGRATAVRRAGPYAHRYADPRSQPARALEARLKLTIPHRSFSGVPRPLPGEGHDSLPSISSLRERSSRCARTRRCLWRRTARRRVGPVLGRRACSVRRILGRRSARPVVAPEPRKALVSGVPRFRASRVARSMRGTRGASVRRQVSAPWGRGGLQRSSGWRTNVRAPTNSRC